jgi:hypothetical protein
VEYTAIWTIYNILTVSLQQWIHLVSFSRDGSSMIWWWGGGGGDALPALVLSCVGHVCRPPINLLHYCKVLLVYCIWIVIVVHSLLIIMLLLKLLYLILSLITWFLLIMKNSAPSAPPLARTREEGFVWTIFQRIVLSVYFIWMVFKDESNQILCLLFGGKRLRN